MSPAPSSDDRGRFAVRGVIEGFYGPPWTWAERQRLVPFLGVHGFTAYAYAPKNDPRHRDRWRDPYLPEEWERFADLVRGCREVGVDFVFGVSPLGFRFHRRRDRIDCDAGDLEALVAKVTAADAVGVRTFCLLVDDMPARTAVEDQIADEVHAGVGRSEHTSAAADVTLVQAVHAAVSALGPDRRLWFVPQPYCGTTDTPYLRQLGAQIPAGVEICWTGPDVCSAEISLAHAREVAQVLQRPPLIWDNHPVNDGAMQHDPHLGPLRGRHPRLAETVSGVVANLALEPESSRIALATVADYACDPAGYDPDRAWDHALTEIAGDATDAAAVASLAGIARRTPLEAGRSDTLLTPVIADFWRCWHDGGATRRAAVDDMTGRLHDLAAHAERLTGTLANAHLRADLKPWARKLFHLVTAAQLALEVARGALDAAGSGGARSGDAASTRPREHFTAQRHTVLDHLEAARATLHWVGGDELDVFARKLLLSSPHVDTTEATPDAGPGG